MSHTIYLYYPLFAVIMTIIISVCIMCHTIVDVLMHEHFNSNLYRLAYLIGVVVFAIICILR